MYPVSTELHAFASTKYPEIAAIKIIALAVIETKSDLVLRITDTLNVLSLLYHYSKIVVLP